MELDEAAGTGNIEAIKQHIAAGADVNVKDDRLGWTPLHHAALYGDKEISELLIANGADVNAKDRVEATPLHYATAKSWCGDLETAKLLISKGADVNAKDNDGRTPLHYATRYGHEEIAELLVAEGADVNAKYNDADTKEIAELLITNGLSSLFVPRRTLKRKTQNDTDETAELLE
jgi:cytohesin